MSDEIEKLIPIAVTKLDHYERMEASMSFRTYIDVTELSCLGGRERAGVVASVSRTLRARVYNQMRLMVEKATALMNAPSGITKSTFEQSFGDGKFDVVAVCRNCGSHDVAIHCASGYGEVYCVACSNHAKVVR